jgi:hypothetical protein
MWSLLILYSSIQKIEIKRWMSKPMNNGLGCDLNLRAELCKAYLSGDWTDHEKYGQW